MKLLTRIWRYFFPKPVYLMSADQWFVTYIGDPNHKIKTYKREEPK